MQFFKRKAPYSIQKLFSKCFFALFFCTSGALIFYCVMLIWNHSMQMSYSADSAMDYCTSSLRAEMVACANFEQKLCYGDNSFQLLTMSNLKDYDKVVYLYNVKETLERHVAPYECIFVFDKDYDISTYAAGSALLSNGTQQLYYLKEGIREYWLNDRQTNFDKWVAFQNDYYSVLMRTVKVRDVYVCSIIDLNEFDPLEYAYATHDLMTFGFFDENGILAGGSGIELDLDTLLKPPGINAFSDQYVVTAPVEGTEISMFCLFRSDYSWWLTRWLMILFILVAVVMCIGIFFFYYFFRKIMFYPLSQINTAAKHLEQDGVTSFLQNSKSNIIEYRNINAALQDLISQKISLHNEKEKEAIEKDHARLQYYQLQTNSHFFVNCLKSLYSMLENKEYEKMRRMILAFSNHLRYVFHDNLKLVTLQSELAEVNDYYHIILLDRVTPFILNTNVDSSLLSYQVPSLLIQTFLENTAKYNKQSGLLIFDVDVRLTELEGVPVMQIMLSDNGVGYSAEMLELLNSPEADQYAMHHVGISNLKQRIALIYKSHYQFAFYNKPSGGACGLIYLPLKTDSEE